MSRKDDIQVRDIKSRASEIKFETMMQVMDVPYKKTGWSGEIPIDDPRFTQLNKTFRKMPDYIAWINGKPEFFEVKSAHTTFFMKKYNHDMYGKFLMWHRVFYAITYNNSFLLVDWKFVDRIYRNYATEVEHDKVEAHIIPVEDLKQYGRIL
tara:strand:- start:1301 stop:1756 length:456 start_codon:yes stop_codon:yes gene_type:complete